MLTSHIDPVTAAVWRLAERLRPVPATSLTISAAAGHVLSQPILADRDSPPLNVSAMDGYAFRISDLIAATGTLPVAAVATAGKPAPELPAGASVRIFTGAPVPSEADVVVPREQTEESPHAFTLRIPASELVHGQHIRVRGENGRAGSEVLPAGTLLSSNAIAAVASMAAGLVEVHRPVRVAIMNTGDELVEPGATAMDWQIRDSNGPTLDALLAGSRWIEPVSRVRAADSLDTITERLRDQLATADAVLLTGGVSMGDTDHVPAAIAAVGGEVVFHRLPIRPGKPVLGAVTADGKLIVGLPGNPVSVAVTATVVAMPLLRHLAGLAEIIPACPRVMVINPDDRQIPLTWYRLVRFSDDGTTELIDNRGSGDLIALGRSDGFITQSAGARGAGPWPWTRW